MSSADGAVHDPQGSAQPGGLPGDQVQTQLVEALMLVLIEKGLLARGDALSVVQTVAQVQRGVAHEGRISAASAKAAMAMLQRMYASFEAFPDGVAALPASWDNVRPLRPPNYADRPGFPGDD